MEANQLDSQSEKDSGPFDYVDQDMSTTVSRPTTHTDELVLEQDDAQHVNKSATMTLKSHVDYEEIKYETVSHTCAQSVKNARMAAEMTQTALAKKVNEKP